MTNIEKRASFIAIRYTQHITSEEMLEVGRKQRSLTIGIPLDTDKSENRVSLTPQGVELLVENGHKVVIGILLKQGPSLQVVRMKYSDQISYLKSPLRLRRK